MRQIATVAYIIGILVLFILDREKGVRTSKALWLPVAWLLIISSRPVTVWLGIAPASSDTMYLEGSPIDRNIYLGLVAAAVFVLIQRRSVVMRVLRANP